jgi:hypothetical protein
MHSVYNRVMIANSRKLRLCLMVLVGMIGIDMRAMAHVVVIDNVLDLVADRDHASGELIVPIPAMLTWSAALAGRTTPDKTDDPLAYAKAHGDEVVKGLDLTYGDIEMEAKVTGTSMRKIDTGMPEDLEPVPVAVYKLEFTPKRKIVAPPTEISFGHQLLAVPEQFQPVDSIVMCAVHFHQVGVTAVKNEAVGVEEHVTFKCKWPQRPATAPAGASIAPTIKIFQGLGAYLTSYRSAHFRGW